MESNQLTQDCQEPSGVQDFIKCLYKNKSLISLNMANNNIDDKLGQLFEEALQPQNNKTLIDFEFAYNNFTQETTIKIQDHLKRNHAEYRAERLKEWKERKLMNAEDVSLKNLYLEEHSRKEQDRFEEEAKALRDEELDEQWRKYLLEAEIEKNQLIMQLEEAAKIRQEKGKKKRRKGGKKKKK